MNIRAERILIFNEVSEMASLGIDEEAFRKGGNERSREIGAAARFLDMEGLVVPSARWACTNLFLFLDRLSDRDSLEFLETRDINWPAWRENKPR